MSLEQQIADILNQELGRDSLADPFDLACRIVLIVRKNYRDKFPLVMEYEGEKPKEMSMEDHVRLEDVMFDICQNSLPSDLVFRGAKVRRR